MKKFPKGQKQKQTAPWTSDINQLKNEVGTVHADLETTHFSILERIYKLEERVKELEREHPKSIRTSDDTN